MRQIALNSYRHYKVVPTSDGMVLLEFGEACPEMGDREEYDDSEGRVVATIGKGEEVQFIAHQYITMLDPADFEDTGVMCGDDFMFRLRTDSAWWAEGDLARDMQERVNEAYGEDVPWDVIRESYEGDRCSSCQTVFDDPVGEDKCPCCDAEGFMCSGIQVTWKLQEEFVNFP